MALGNALIDLKRQCILQLLDQGFIRQEVKSVNDGVQIFYIPLQMFLGY